MSDDYCHLRTLGLAYDASQSEIQRAYRQLAQQYHPDLHPLDPDAAKRFIEIQYAYEMLCRPEGSKNVGAYHTVMSAFATVRCHARHRVDGVLTTGELIAALVATAAAFWLLLGCSGVMMSAF